MTTGSIAPKPLIAKLAKAARLTGLSTEKFRQKLASAPGHGFEKTEWERITKQFKSGTLKMSKPKTIKLLRAFKDAKFLPNIQDVSGSVEKYIKTQSKSSADADKARAQKEAVEKIKQDRIKKLNLLKRQGENRYQNSQIPSPAPASPNVNQNLQLENAFSIPSPQSQQAVTNDINYSQPQPYQNPFEHPATFPNPTPQAKAENDLPDLPID